MPRHDLDKHEHAHHKSIVSIPHHRPSRRKRWMKKAMLGGMAVLAGAGAQQSGLLDFSPAHTAQLVMTREAAAPAATDLVVRNASLSTPAEAAATPAVIAHAADFDPAEFATRTGTVVQTGEASYYGDDFAGRPTANGETFDPDSFTAAHKTLPLGSVVRVTNLKNGTSVVLRVNDRGPYVGDRVLDVSHGAAKALGMEGSGTANVRIEVL